MGGELDSGGKSLYPKNGSGLAQSRANCGELGIKMKGGSVNAAVYAWDAA